MRERRYRLYLSTDHEAKGSDSRIEKLMVAFEASTGSHRTLDRTYLPKASDQNKSAVLLTNLDPVTIAISAKSRLQVEKQVSSLVPAFLSE